MITRKMEQFNSYRTFHHHPSIQLSFALCFIFSCFPVSFSEIKNTWINNDYRSIILFENFAFGKNGHVEISVRNVTLKSRHQDARFNPSSMGFFIANSPSLLSIWNKSEYTDGFCILSSNYGKPIFKFENLSYELTYSGSIEIDEPDEYNLVFGNCQPEFKVSMHVHTEMYNLKDGEKDFLPSGQTQLPKVYFIFFLIYAGFFLIWGLACINQRPQVGKIHLIMSALLLFKCLKTICAAEDQMYVRKTGTSHGWDVAFYVFGFFKGIILFTVIILIGSGWSFLKPYLQDREKQVLMTVIPLQVLENIAYVVICETGPATRDWMTWNQMFLLIDIVCCCVVFFPIIWSIRSLREASKIDGKAAKNLEKLTLFKQFYIVVIGYLYFSRIVVSAIGAFFSYRWEWMLTVLQEGASLVFYIFIFYKFQPMDNNPYFVATDEEEIAAAQLLEEDNSFEL